MNEEEFRPNGITLVNTSQFNMAYLMYTATLFLNDLLHIHWHSTGEHFDSIHPIAEEYYDKVLENRDWFAEKAVSKQEEIVNPTKVSTIFDETVWSPEHLSNYSFSDFVMAIRTKGNDYIDSLRNCIYQDSEIKSKIDEFLDYWTKEVQYKNEQRAK